MNPSPSTPFSDVSFALSLGLLLVAPLAIAGVALINTGLGRSRSAAQSLLGSLVVISTAVIAFLAVGAAFSAASAGSDHIFRISGRQWDWAGASSLFLRGFASVSARTQLALLFETMAVALATMIPWGSGADRLRLPAGAAIASVLPVLVFPFLAHWTWGGGWLSQLGANFSLGMGFLDAGGAACVHVLGGLSALAAVWIAGPRKGKFPREGLATAMPGHNLIYVLFGCMLALAGWLAWNMAGAMLWLNAAPTSLVITAINTLLAAAAALVAAFSVTRVRFGKPDASLCANGWLAGLVTSSACAALVTPFEAVVIGMVAGIIAPLLVELFELALSIDDPAGAVSVHAAAGLWGLAAVGIFTPRSGQFLAQLIGISTLLGLVLPVVYLIFWLIDHVLPFRADPDGERLGMDLHELGGGAYPEFVIHRDESYR